MADDIWSINGGLYLGFFTNKTEGPPPNINKSPLLMATDRHAVLVAPNGAGKSRRVILPQLASLLGWSIVVLDVPKGELTRATAKHRRDAGNEINIIDPYGASGMKSRGFNPVAMLGNPVSDDFVDDAQAYAQATIPVSEREPHWGASAQDLWAALMMYSRLTDPAGGSYAHCRKLLGQSITAFVETIRNMMEAGIVHDCPELTIKASRYSDLTPDSRELASIISTTLTATSWIDSRPLRRNLSETKMSADGEVDNGVINFSRMKEVPTVTYICLPGNRVFSHAPWLKLVITSILQALMRKAGQPKVPVMLLIDEASIVGGLNILERSLPVLRGYGVKVFSVYQDANLAKLSLGERYSSYIANAGILLAFAPQDPKTAAELSERTGQTTAQVLAYSSNPEGHKREDDKGGTLNISQTHIPGMLPQDLMNMDPGFAVAFTHQTKGTMRLYLPDPADMPELAALAKLMG